MKIRERLLSAAHRDELRTLRSRSHQVLLLAAITGATTGLIVAGFERLVVEVMFENVLDLPLWLIAVMPGIGLLAALAARRFIGGGVSPSTADEYLHAFHDSAHRLDWRAYAGRIVAAVATLGSGGADGSRRPVAVRGLDDRLAPAAAPGASRSAARTAASSSSPAQRPASPRSSRPRPPARCSRSRSRTAATSPDGCSCRR